MASDEAPLPIKRLRSPDYFLHKIRPEDHGGLSVIFRRMSEQTYRDTIHLDYRTVALNETQYKASLEKVLEACEAMVPVRPIHYVSHHFFSGSTLLARILERLDCYLVHKEPTSLRTWGFLHGVLEPRQTERYEAWR